MRTFCRISLKLIKFLCDLLEYNALLIIKFVPIGSTILAFLAPSSSSGVPEIVFTFAIIGTNSVKYFEVLNIVSVVPLLISHDSPVFDISSQSKQ